MNKYFNFWIILSSLKRCMCFDTSMLKWVSVLNIDGILYPIIDSPFDQHLQWISPKKKNIYYGLEYLNEFNYHDGMIPYSHAFPIKVRSTGNKH